MASNEELTIKIKVCTRREWDVFFVAVYNYNSFVCNLPVLIQSTV